MNRVRRLTFVATPADSPVKVTDPLPNLNWEQEKETTITPATNRQYVNIILVEAEIGVNWTGTLMSHSTIVHLGYSIENVGDAAKTAPDVEIGNISPFGVVTRNDCVLDNFTNNSATVSYTGRLGVGVIVRFWMKYTGGPGTSTAPTAYCIRNANIDYNDVTKRIHGGPR